MKQISVHVDDKSSPLTKVAAYVAVPVVVVLALPLLLLLILILYLAAIIHGAKVCIRIFTWQPPAPEVDLPPPHFLASHARALPDDSTADAKG